ncbi:MAG: YtxH domain-containing protein [Bacillota bacterium]|nr:YtxH domain-containing protein [Bacillota bacterium]MDP4170324.1 YtxH domain-containing protein [Bacillota bacterium]
MSGTSRFWKGMLFGAAAGGSLSLLNKETRHAVLNGCKSASGNLKYVISNPGNITNQLKGAAKKLRVTVEQVTEDIAYITDKVEELKEATPLVTEILKETKDVFVDKDSLASKKNEMVLSETEVIVAEDIL